MGEARNLKFGVNAISWMAKYPKVGVVSVQWPIF